MFADSHTQQLPDVGMNATDAFHTFKHNVIFTEEFTTSSTHVDIKLPFSCTIRTLNLLLFL